MSVEVQAALRQLAAGRPVLVVDDEHRENEGDLIVAAELATPATMAFMVRHTTGILCVALTAQRAAQLRLPLMVADGDEGNGTAFTVSVDVRANTTTGVSASDRSRTVRALADPNTKAEHLSRPGHIFPLIARDGGVLERRGHTESAVDLCRLAGLHQAGVLAEITNDDGTMARRPELERFAGEHGLAMVSVAQLVEYRGRTEQPSVRQQAAGRIPTAHGEFTALTFRSNTGIEHVALVMGDVDQRSAADPAPVLVRVHSECLTGDVFGSLRCDCGEQLDLAIAQIARAGRGVVVYLRGHEGRGIGLSDKLRAYGLQDQGFDTVDANLAQGLPVDSRDFGDGALILEHLGVRDVLLITNNPTKAHALTGAAVRVARTVPAVVAPNPHNARYLRTKAARMGHLLGASANAGADTDAGSLIAAVAG